jgi:hypothetical protein
VLARVSGNNDARQLVPNEAEKTEIDVAIEARIPYLKNYMEEGCTCRKHLSRLLMTDGASPGKSACEPRVPFGCSAVQEHNECRLYIRQALLRVLAEDRVSLPRGRMHKRPPDGSYWASRASRRA